MAKSGQKFKTYDDDFRNKVVSDYFNNSGGVERLARLARFLKENNYIAQLTVLCIQKVLKKILRKRTNYFLTVKNLN